MAQPTLSSHGFEVRKAKRVFVAFTIGAAALTAVLVWLIVSMMRELPISEESPNWPHVTGEIVYSLLEEGGAKSGHSCHARIDYRYRVDQTQYEGHKVTYRILGCSKAARAVEEHPKGTPVTVFYRPIDPQVSVLEPGPWDGAAWLIFWGAVFSAVGLTASTAFLWGLIVRRKLRAGRARLPA
jgi:hypothetical protein